MKKIVVNKCFGGFGLSHKAIMRYAEIKGFKLYPFVEERDANGNLNFDKYKPYIEGEKAFFIHYSKKPLKNGKDVENAYFSDRDIPRNDVTLVQIVKELGVDANGDFAKLEITEIPDDVNWEIDEYDGLETIHEKHRSW